MESIKDKRLRLWKARQEAEGHDVSGVTTLEQAEHFFDKKAELPEVPVIPEVPEVLEIPEIPEIPEVTEEPAAEEVPEVPAEEEVPAAPKKTRKKKAKEV